MEGVSIFTFRVRKKRMGLLHVSPSKPSAIILFMCYYIFTGLIDFVIPFPKVFIRVVPSLYQLINPKKLDFAFLFGKDRKVLYSIFVSKDIQCFDFLGILILVFQTIHLGRPFVWKSAAGLISGIISSSSGLVADKEVQICWWLHKIYK